MTKDEALKQALEAFAQYAPFHLTEKERIAEAAIKEALAQPVQAEQQSTERNFCPRCGKRRGGDVNYIHTCTPPTPKAQNDVA